MPDISIWRTTIAPGEVTYIWTRVGHLPVGKAGAALGGNTYTLDDSIQLTQFSWARTFNWDDPTYATGLKVPANAQPGNYHLHVHGAETGINITIEAPPVARPFVNVPPSGGADSAAISAALNDGKNVQLSAGVYTIDSTISLPAGASVRGAHRDVTILKRVPREGDYANRLFTATGDYITLSDFTAEGVFANYPILFHNHPDPIRNATFQRLRLRSTGSIIAIVPGAFVQDIEFINAGGIIGGDHQLWKDISFQGVGPDANESIAVGNQFALINANWRDTGRGLILRDGPTDSYFNCLSFSGIDQISNGNEVILTEDAQGTGLQNCIFSYISIQNCAGAITFYLTPMINNLFITIRMEGGGGILFVPGKTKQTDNFFDSTELRFNPGVHLGGATGNEFKGLAIISPRPSWVNQAGFMPAYYARTAAITGSSGNVFNPLTIVDLPEGWTEKD